MKKEDKIVEDVFQIFMIEDAELTKKEEEYPIIKEYMVATELPKKIMPFDKAIKFKGDLSDTFISFYAKDSSFLRIKKNPKAYLKFFKRTAGFIGFDFSIYSDLQKNLQTHQINENLKYTYYYANQGNKCIPNLRCGIDETVDEFLEALPKHTLLSIGTHGFIITNAEKAEWYCFLERVIRELQPTGIIVVGPFDDEIFDNLKEQCPFYYYNAWIKDDLVRRNQNVSKGQR